MWLSSVAVSVAATGLATGDCPEVASRRRPSSLILNATSPKLPRCAAPIGGVPTHSRSPGAGHPWSGARGPPLDSPGLRAGRRAGWVVAQRCHGQMPLSDPDPGPLARDAPNCPTGPARPTPPAEDTGSPWPRLFPHQITGLGPVSGEDGGLGNGDKQESRSWKLIVNKVDRRFLAPGQCGSVERQVDREQGPFGRNCFQQGRVRQSEATEGGVA